MGRIPYLMLKQRSLAVKLQYAVSRVMGDKVDAVTTPSYFPVVAPLSHSVTY
jgi:hypothetical protein